jgi:hypothetical protein
MTSSRKTANLHHIYRATLSKCQQAYKRNRITFLAQQFREKPEAEGRARRESLSWKRH